MFKPLETEMYLWNWADVIGYLLLTEGKAKKKRKLNNATAKATTTPESDENVVTATSAGTESVESSPKKTLTRQPSKDNLVFDMAFSTIKGFKADVNLNEAAKLDQKRGKRGNLAHLLEKVCVGFWYIIRYHKLTVSNNLP